jgi:sugar lactone lactonase YvrE
MRSLPHARNLRRLVALAPLACALALPAPVAAQMFQVEGSFGSSLAPDGRFANAAGVATDDAGRVYVADSGAGRVEIYDNARGGNAFLRTLGEAELECPVGIRIDNRGRVYVADACRHVVAMFDSFVDDNTVRRQFGGTGTSFGQMANPRFLAVDRSAHVYVAERDNVRVQSWRPSGGRQIPVAAFGVAEPPTFLAPEGIARDAEGRLYVSDESASDGEVRAFDRRGRYLFTIAGPGSAPGQVSSPRGLMRDSAGRLVVVDAGNARVQVFTLPGPAGEGTGPGAEEEDGQETGRATQTFTSTLVDASAPGLFVRPSDASLAPGALLYVVDSSAGQVVRVRYDDVDADGALDARDTCPGLANPIQRDTDRDGQGDECDPDDDGDGVADEADRCPRTRRGTDANGDGCGDPRSRISAPRDRKTFRRSRPPSRLTGRASADELGVDRVQYALARVRGRRCAWYTGRGFGPAASCAEPVWIDAQGDQRWSARVRIRARGTYRLLSRAIQRDSGVTESAFTRRNVKTFRVR